MLLITGIVFEESKRRQREIYIGGEGRRGDICDVCMYDMYVRKVMMIMMDEHDGVRMCVLAVWLD